MNDILHVLALLVLSLNGRRSRIINTMRSHGFGARDIVDFICAQPRGAE